MLQIIKMAKQNIGKVLLGVVAVIVIAVIGVLASKTNDEPLKSPDVMARNEFEVLDSTGKEIDYGREYLSDGRIDSSRERIFSRLDQDLTRVVDEGATYSEGREIYTASQDPNGAVAVFDFRSDKKVVLENYIESPLFTLPFIFSELIDLDNDGNKDIFLISHSGNFLDAETPWIFLSRNGGYVLANVLSPAGINRDAYLRGDQPGENLMEIRAHAGSRAVWTRDLDGDGKFEVITIDKGTFEDDPSNNRFRKKIYEVSGNAYILRSESAIVRDDADYQQLKSWPVVPEPENN